MSAKARTCSGSTLTGTVYAPAVSYAMPPLSHAESRMLPGKVSEPIANASGATVGTLSTTLPVLCNDGTVVAQAESVTVSCTASGYVASAFTCVPNACHGTVPAHASAYPASSQSAGVSWAYADSAGTCKFGCEAGYSWNGSACADTTPPTIAMVSTGSSACETVTFTVSATDAVAPYTPASYSFDGKATWQASSAKSFSGTSVTKGVGQIWVKDAAGNEAQYGSSVTGTAASCLPPAPSAPTGLAPSSITQTSFTLYWNATDGATAYEVYKDGAAIDTNVTATTKSVTGLSAGTAYSMTVKAKNPGGISPASSALSVTTTVAAPSAPAKLAATSVSQASVTWNWSASAGATGYQFSTDNSSFSDIGNVTSKTDGGLSCGTSHSRYVKACNGGGCSSATALDAQSTSACAATAYSKTATYVANDRFSIGGVVTTVGAIGSATVKVTTG